MTQYKKLPGYEAPTLNQSQVTAINSSGVAVGYYESSNGDTGYLVRGGVTEPELINVMGSPTRIRGIDDAGDIVGNYDNPGQTYGFARLASNGAIVLLRDALPDALKGGSVVIRAASRSGEIAGYYEAQTGNVTAFTADVTATGFENFKLEPLVNANGNPVSSDSILPLAVNDQGDFVGYYTNHNVDYGFIEHDGTTTTLQVLGSTSTTANGINNDGEVVGTFVDPSGIGHGFSYTTSGGYQLREVAGSTSTAITGINDSGQLTGTYSTANGTFGFVETGNDVTTIDSTAHFVPTAINDAGLVAGNLNGPDGAVFGPATPAQYSVAASGDVQEGTTGPGNTITYTVTRSGDTSSAATVDVTLSGTATPSDDYTVAGLDGQGRLAFAAGATTASFTVTTKPDAIVEPDETVVATLSNPTDPGAVISQASATAKILNDDVAPPGGGGGAGGGGAGGGGGAAGGGAQPGATPPSNTGTNPPSNNTAAPSVAFNPDVTVAPGDVVTLSGTYTAATPVSSIVVAENGAALGSATVNPNGTWSLVVDFNGRPGPHAGLSATATDAQGVQGTAKSPYSLTTGLTKRETGGEPYRTVQDRHDPATGALTGSVFFNRNGGEYLASRLTADADGGTTYTYSGGSFFAKQDYTSFADHYAADATLTQHATFSAGVETANVLAGGQTIDAADPAATGGTRFVFSPGIGDSTVVDFATRGSGHDTIDLGHTSAGRLAQILGHAQDDGAGNTVLSIGHGDTLTLAGIAPGELTRRDFALHG